MFGVNNGSAQMLKYYSAQKLNQNFFSSYQTFKRVQHSNIETSALELNVNERGNIFLSYKQLNLQEEMEIKNR